MTSLIYSIGWALVHSVWQAALAAVLLALLLRLTRRASSNLRYVMSCATLAAVIAAGAITAVTRSRSVQHVDASVVAQPVQVTAEAPISPRPPIDDVVVSRWTMQRVMPWLVAVWGVGVIGLSVWQFSGWVALRRYRRAALPVDARWSQRVQSLAKKMNVKRVVLAITDRLDVPVVIGMLRPMILAPISMLSEMPAQQIEAILAHELAHIRRHDYLANLIQAAIETLLFYHPAVWWISKQIRRERECCCDEMAAAICGDRAEYARSLTALEESRAPRLAPAARTSRSELLLRMRRLLGVADGQRRSRSWTLAVILLILGAVVPISTRGQSAPSTQSSAIRPDDLAVSHEDYRIGPNDLLNVSVAGPQLKSEIVSQSRVSESGSISLPVIGAIKATGLSEAEFQSLIAKTYHDHTFGPGHPAKFEVSVSVVERRNWIVSIYGAVGQVGQYAIPQRDFRLLDALVLAHGAAAGTNIRVVRYGSEPNRILQISTDDLTSGDPTFNVVIRPKDFILVSEPQLKSIRITVTADGLLMNDKPTTWPEVRKSLAAMPEPERKQTYIAIAVSSGDLPVQRFFQAQNEASLIVQELGLAHVSNVGIDTALAREK